MSLFHKFFARQPNKKPIQRRRSELRFDTLEERATPTANTISGFVYQDTNNNGVFDAGELPIANTAITLKNAQGTVVGTTTTNGQGAYTFATDSSVSTAPTTLVRTVSFPDTDTGFDLNGSVAQFDPSLGQLTSITIHHAGSITSTIRVENISRSSGTTITANISGSLELKAPGVDNTLNVSANAGNFVAAKNDGILDFGGTAGNNFGAKTANGSDNITLTGNQLAGWSGTGQVAVESIGIATSNTTGGGNVATNITSSGQSTITVTYNYIPQNCLTPGNYTIIETQPQGFNDGIDAINNVPQPNSVGTDTLNVTLGTTNLVNNNFGELAPAQLCGYVYVDANNNGIKDGNETPIGNVTLTLNGFTSSGPVSTTTTTDGAGFYCFKNLLPGTYAIVENQPTSYLDGKDAIGSQGGNVANDNFSGIAVVGGTNGINNNFGELLPAKLSGCVYHDVDKNGTKNAGDIVLPNVTITLGGTDDTGAAVSQTMVTDSLGCYSFVNLRPGTYTVTETQPANFADGQMNLGTQGGTIGNNVFTAINLASGANGENYNFGEVINAVADLAIVKTANPSQVKVGDTLSYTLTVTNLGTFTAQGVKVVDTLPAGVTLLNSFGNGWSFSNTTTTLTATMPSLASGASTIITLQVKVPAVSDTLVNVAVVSSDTPDPNQSNNRSTVTTPVITPAKTLSVMATAAGVVTGVRSKRDLLVSSRSNQTGTTASAAATSNSLFVDGLYQTLLGRSVDQATQTFLTNQLNAGVSRSTIVQQVYNSAEQRTIQTNALYQSTLGRNATPAELASTVAALQAGTSSQSVQQQLFTSAEYQTQNPISQTLVGSLYLNLTGKLPTSSQNAATVQAMDNTPLGQLVQNLQQTTDAVNNQINNIYRSVLRRNATATELATYASGFQNGTVTDAGLTASLLTSAEFYNLAVASRVK